MLQKLGICITTFIFFILTPTLYSQSIDLVSLSLAELSEIKISSVSKKEERLQSSAASIHIITSDDIAKSNAQSIPELLRLVPGLHVGRVDGSNWAISARGLNGVFNDKMLVMIDGRSVYTPLFGGVFWQVQDTPLEDISRIEVILGPSGSIWGANAQNGVINIITKKASQTLGSLFSTSISNEGQTLTARHGLKIDSNSSLRTYARGRLGSNFDQPNSEVAFNGYGLGQTGFKFEKRVNDNNFTLQGDWYAGNVDLSVLDISTLNPAFIKEVSDVSGGNIIANWNKNFSDGSNLESSIYFDRTNRFDSILKNSISTLDSTLQYNLSKIESHSLTFGIGYRLIEADLFTFKQLEITNYNNSFGIGSAFIQDIIDLSDKSKLTLSTRMDHHEFVGAMWQPSAKISYDLDSKNTLWSSVSSASTLPTISNNNLNIVSLIETGDSNNPFVPAVIGSNTALDPQKVVGYEAGIRGTPADWFKFDLSVFYNKYSDLVTFQPNFTVQPIESSLWNIPSIPIGTTGNGELNSYGTEISTTIDFQQNLRLKSWYTNLNLDQGDSGLGVPTGINNFSGKTPSNQFFARLDWDINERYSIYPSIRYVDSVPEFKIPSYVSGGIKLKYNISKKSSFAIGVENLFAPNHFEYQSDFIILPRTEIPTLWYTSLRIDF
jgi:iron complex outermembrane receptor protein